MRTVGISTVPDARLDRLTAACYNPRKARAGDDRVHRLSMPAGRRAAGARRVAAYRTRTPSCTSSQRFSRYPSVPHPAAPSNPPARDAQA